DLRGRQLVVGLADHVLRGGQVAVAARIDVLRRFLGASDGSGKNETTGDDLGEIEFHDVLSLLIGVRGAGGSAAVGRNGCQLDFFIRFSKKLLRATGVTAERAVVRVLRVAELVE